MSILCAPARKTDYAQGRWSAPGQFPVASWNFSDCPETARTVTNEIVLWGLVIAMSGLVAILIHLRLAIILPIALAVNIFGHGDRTRVQRLGRADRQTGLP